MTIDPRVGFYLSICLAIFGVLTTGGTQLIVLFGEHTTSVIIALAMLLMTIGNAVNAVLHAIPSSVPPTAAAAKEFPLGPSVPPKP